MAMRIAVMGAGAIGLLYGGWLQQGGADVTFIARGPRLDALRTSPVTAEGRLPFRLDSVRAVATPQQIAPVDALLLCVKLYDLLPAATFALPALKPDGVLIAVQNGISTFERLKPLLPADQIAVGPVYAVTRQTSLTSVAYGGSDRTVIGSPAGGIAPVVRDIVDIWHNVGVDAATTDNIETVLWVKFLAVATAAAIMCVTRLPAGVAFHDDGILTYVKQSIDEIISVGRAAGVSFPEGAAETALALLCNLPPASLASMRQDLDAGRRLELDGFSGEIARLGRHHGVPTPLHQMVFDMLRPFRDGPPQLTAA
jgi:2-dehydropantoate 2-reductase